MSDAEVVREAVRLALSALRSIDAKWVMQHMPMGFIRSCRKSGPSHYVKQTELEELTQPTAEESRWLLDHLALLAEPSLQQLPELRQLAQIWDEQYQYVDEPTSLVAVKRGKDYRPNRIRNPHVPEATYGSKADDAKTWIGFKLHITETIDGPRCITDVTWLELQLAMSLSWQLFRRISFSKTLRLICRPRRLLVP